jgi:hypothetical protein
MTGEKYQKNGHPYLTEVAVAYYVSTAVSALTDPATNDFLNTPSAAALWPVANTQLDFSNPLFIWSDLDMLGESTQQSMMYQNLVASDPNYGYGQYTIQSGSTSFTVWTPGSNGGSVVYAYSSTSSDDNGNPYITTQSGTSAPVVTQQTDMSQALLSDLNGGAYLLSKSCIMNVNGAATSSSSLGSSTVTVTETFVAPKQYSVSYSAISPVTTTDDNGNKIPVIVQITDTFQAPVVGQSTGGSQNYYNNPPLDDALQQQFIAGIPFCAQYLGGMTSGQAVSLVTTESPIIQTICGILTQPADPTKYISD